MAYKNNLLEYYGGGSVPYQGYQSGGGVDLKPPTAQDMEFYLDWRLKQEPYEKALKRASVMREAGYLLPKSLLEPAKGFKESLQPKEMSRIEDLYNQYWRGKGLKGWGEKGAYKELLKKRKILDMIENNRSEEIELNKGGSVGNSLLGMQRGGYTGGFGGGRVRANLARYRKIRDASEDVSRRAKEIKEKKAKSGLFGKILGKAAEWGTGALLAPILGPGALIAAKAVGRGIGSYAGAKAGYGDKVGSGLEQTKWLASDRKKLERSEKGLEESFKGAGYAGVAAGAMKGVTDYAKSQGADSVEDWLQAKTGIKRNPFETPNYMQGPDATIAQQTYEKALADPTSRTAMAEMGASVDKTSRDIFGQMNRTLMAQDMTDATAADLGADIYPSGAVPELYNTSPSFGGFNIPSMKDPMAGTDPFKYAQSGFGAQVGQKGLLGGLSGLAEGQSNLLAQQPWAQEGFQFAQEPSVGQNLFNQLAETPEQVNPLEWMTNAGFAAPYAGGGMVRDDNALIDMIYRR
jgi:hypothetical protein